MSSSKRCGAIGMWPGSDKAKNDHRPETLGLLGQGRISTMWDGKLYVDGNEGTTPYYTQASDVFMQATIHCEIR